MKKVIGIGGIFFKCKDPEALRNWYSKHLGIEAGKYGFEFKAEDEPESSHRGYTLWNPFPDTTKYFEPSENSFMMNYRVADLEALVEELKKEGVIVLDEIASYDYGKFVHILDLEGNKIELWETKA